jgi:hypothetical protein
LKSVLVGERDLEAARSGGLQDPAAIAEVDAGRAHGGERAVDPELQAGGVRDAAEVRLVGDPPVTDARRHRRVEADAGRETVIGVRPGVEGGRDGRLPHLDLAHARVAQHHVLARSLEVVVGAVEGRDVRVAVEPQGAGVAGVEPVTEARRGGSAAVPAHT